MSRRKESWTAYQNESVLPPLKLVKSKVRLCCLSKLLISWTRHLTSLNKNIFSFPVMGNVTLRAVFCLQHWTAQENAQLSLDTDMVLLSVVIHLTHFATFWEYLDTTSASPACWGGITRVQSFSLVTDCVLKACPLTREDSQTSFLQIKLSYFHFE